MAACPPTSSAKATQPLAFESPKMGAADATLSEALGHLDTTWVAVRDSVLNDRHLLWIGSGISRNRFPALPALLEQLFATLHAAQDPANPDCPYLKTAKEVVHNFSHVEGLDLRQPPAAWPPASKEALFNELAGNYAEVLGQRVNTGGGPLDIPFDILHLDETYGAAAVVPDAEHRLLALLVAEGAVTQIVTTNWDSLTERAHQALGVGPTLQVIACTAELDGAGGAAIVFKVHGCAERTRAEPGKYKRHMVATHNQITRWSIEPFFEPFVERLRTLLRERPSLFVGISGQDFNLQSQCVAASCNGPAVPFPPSRVTFSGTVGVPQRQILEAVYGENYGPNSQAIDTAAALPLYGKPLLGALYVLLVFEKLRVILETSDAQFASDEQRALARTELASLRASLCLRFDALGNDERWQALSREVPAFIARLLELYRNQRLPPNGESYAQIHPLSPALMADDQNLTGTNLHWFCLALAAFSAVAVGAWQLRIPTEADGSDGQLRISGPSGETSLFFTSQDVSAKALLQRVNAIVPGSGRKVLLVYPVGNERKAPRRNPGRILPGGFKSVEPLEVWFQSFAFDFLTTADLITSLKQEISAALPL